VKSFLAGDPPAVKEVEASPPQPRAPVDDDPRAPPIEPIFATAPEPEFLGSPPKAVPVFKPDAPLASRRGVRIVTSSFCGDPPPGRSALDARREAEARR